MISLSVRGYFITGIFAGLCIILREINHPLTDRLIIVSWRMTSVRLYNERRRLTSRLLGTLYGWSTSSTKQYTSNNGHTLVAREYEVSHLGSARNVSSLFVVKFYSMETPGPV